MEDLFGGSAIGIGRRGCSKSMGDGGESFDRALGGED